jgi:hypothetical protein
MRTIPCPAVAARPGGAPNSRGATVRARSARTRGVWGSPPEDTTSDPVRTLRGQGSPKRVGVIEALSHLSRQVRRLLEMAGTWPDDMPVELPPAVGYKTARQLRPAEVDELVDAYQAGATTRELATRFGIWRGTVGKHLEARGIDTRAPKLQPKDIQEAAKLYQAGWTLNKIARQYRVGYNTIRKRLLKAGVVMRPRGGKQTADDS